MINNCYATGQVNGIFNAGGLVGANGGTIRDCYATGAVTGTILNVGGLVGNNGGTIIRCYATGQVNNGMPGAKIGGLVGVNGGKTVNNSFWDMQTSGQATSDGGIGKSSVELKQVSTFIGWGCGFWTIDEGNDTPRLLWENAPGVLITNSIYSGGTGDPDTPYLIADTNDLLDLSGATCDWDKHFKLTADLDLTAINLTPIGFIDIPFSGTFNGNGFAISNLKTNLPAADYVGLFGLVDSDFNLTIFNLDLIDPNIIGDIYVGSLAGALWSGTISECYAYGGVVKGVSSVGGLVGRNHGTISDSTATGRVDGNNAVGGLVGTNTGMISNCTAAGQVNGTNTNVGGLVGINYGTISSCYATGTVNSPKHVGGLIGINNNGTIRICYTTGQVSGTNYVGGLVGRKLGGTIRDCYATGVVSGTSKVGGLLGENDSGTVINSFWDTQMSGQATSDGGTGKNTVQMQMAITFLNASWDFVGEVVNGVEDHWRMCLDGVDYPRLTWQYLRIGDFGCPDGVGMEDWVLFTNWWGASNCNEAKVPSLTLLPATVLIGWADTLLITSGRPST